MATNTPKRKSRTGQVDRITKTRGNCEICQKILKVFHGTVLGYHAGLGSYEDVILSSQCVHHKAFIISVLGSSGPICQRFPATVFDGVQPTWLVDTWLECLTRPSQGEPSQGDSYVALSYVWGDAHMFKSLRTNVDSLGTPDALSVKNGEVSIPATIRDAMSWVQALGERFLWVDSLCIVQDAAEQKYSELANMSGIYANASVTIMDAQGTDVNYGLRGLRGVSQPRAYKQKIHKFGRAHISEGPFLIPPGNHQTIGPILKTQAHIRGRLRRLGVLACSSLRRGWTATSSLQSESITDSQLPPCYHCETGHVFPIYSEYRWTGESTEIL
ncbi:heterokaryon incompatibility protein-domain-containing protein [Apodospora peruviana]|uniref:Heterokaryon incompatibility protein-domain-containing protein n=1 Tax=Apodospora peruviana TaxID=516989 RepID=A0AAE0MA70_9PEZI|nr:heterokaryon incompatibility protein-domain-containing protein [Apodospora peruviana]